MDISKAIEILQTEHDTSYPHTEPAFYQALILSIEALKKLQSCRPYCQFDPEELLPGETGNS